MIGTWVTRQLVFDGLANGLVIGLIAIGLVLVYRATRVINFAVGSLGVVGAAVLVVLVENHSAPLWLATLVALLIGLALGAIVELVVVRRLFTAARVTLLVATIGVAQLLQALVVGLPRVKGATSAKYPVFLSGRWEQFGVSVSGPQVAILVVVPLCAGLLGWFLNGSRLGGAVLASADNARLARTHGINPKVVSTVVWSLAGLLSTLSMVLIAGQAGRATGLSTLGPNTMIRALAAVVIAGMVSFRGALIAGVALGIGQSLVRFNSEVAGLTDFLLFVAVLAAVWARARRDDPQSDSAGVRGAFAPIPHRLRSIWWVRWLPAAGFGFLVACAILLPLVVSRPSRVLLYATVLALAVCSASLTVLAGWAGQISLGQMAFAGIGALSAAALTRGPLPFMVAIPVAALITAALAAFIGVGALRVNGLLLAVVTFAFGGAATHFIYRRPVLSNDQQSSVPFRRGTLFGLDLAPQRTYYYVVLAVLVLLLVALARIRGSGVGRSILAVRDNPQSAAALSVSPMRMRVIAFALSGGIAGLGGALLAGAVQTVPLTDRFFQAQHSLELVAMAVIGGLGTIVGAVLGPLWVAGLPAFFPDNELMPLFVSGAGLLVLLLYFPGGLAQIVHSGRDAILQVARRRTVGAEPRSNPRPTTTVVSPRAVATAHGPAIAATNITVRFGGRVAVDNATVEVQRGQIVGLIGTNGAGKTTLLNAIGGFVPASGSVMMSGHDVSSASAHARAKAGLGRTFQAARLFPELTVRDTVLVALEARKRTSLIATVTMMPWAGRAERAKASEADALIDLLGLGRYADEPTDHLSTGTRRIVELASLLALGASVLCLDEPTAGVAQRETEAMAPLLQSVRAELDAAMLVIEHDMPFITGISDRLYCLEAGRVIANGSPDEVRRDPLVIASYLGTDPRSIERSGIASHTEDT